MHRTNYNPYELIQIKFHDQYKHQGVVYCRNSLSLGKIYEIELNKHFSNGYKIASSHADKMREVIREDFSLVCICLLTFMAGTFSMITAWVTGIVAIFVGIIGKVKSRAFADQVY